jgi:hypothetical protein
LPEACADDPAVKRVSNAISQAKDALLENFDNADSKLDLFKKQIETEYAKWSPQFQTAKKSYNDAVQKEGGDYRNLAQNCYHQLSPKEFDFGTSRRPPSIRTCLNALQCS